MWAPETTEFDALDKAHQPMEAAAARIQSLCDEGIAVHVTYAHGSPLCKCIPHNHF